MARDVVGVSDPRILRAMAHPTRTAVFYELFAHGTATATTLARAVDRPVNAVSFHLRQLAKYGLIEEAPELAKDHRERWWRPASKRGLSLHFDDVAAAPGGEAALELFRANNAANWHAWIDRFFADDRPEPERAGAVRASNDVPLLLTEDEAREPQEELLAVLFRYNESGRSAHSSDERRTYLALMLLMPTTDARRDATDE